ncbi:MULTISPECIES: hypothetical protein [Deinococcus]|uniref:Uncharacterized protein n=1 Tax=Deinococcus aquaticus TaxID=328692 RepID=A0ABY7V2R6_9DEIO|nr:hypothetical protein [Deinococcus aquaticus]WDA59474.1 hypothetical protein M8445_04485 [Deinococcus aquaticus]
MTEPMQFGRQAVKRPPFEISGISFSSLPLSLAEEKRLAGAGADATTDDAAMDALLGILAELLNARTQGESVGADWLMENLTAGDLEGIVSYLRGEAAAD